MKIGMRKPNLKKRVKARTTGKLKRTVKKSVNPLYGKKGMGLINDPKKAVYNKVYNKSTFDALPTSTKSNKRKSTKSSSRNKLINLNTTKKPLIENSERSTGEEISNITALLGCFSFILLAMSIFNPSLFIITIPLLVYVFYRSGVEQKEHAKKAIYKENEISDLDNKIRTQNKSTSYTLHNKNEYENTQGKNEYDYIRERTLDNEVTVLDFETTGFSPTDDHIIQIAAIKFHNGDEIDRFTTYVNPQVPISSKITRITGITNVDVANAPTIKEVIADLNNFLRNETIVAHNASFDMKFLLENLKRYNIQHERFRVIDTLQLARKYINETDNHKLTTLKDFLQIEAVSHDALEDCKVTGSLYYYCRELEINAPGNYKGKHFTKYVDSIVEMKRANENVKAINLLLNLVDAVETESKENNWGPAPWYYEQLAILFRKEREHENEVGILERYIDTCKKYGVPNGAKHSKLMERYEKLINKKKSHTLP